MGANVSNDGFENRYEAVRAFERGLGRQLSIVNRFHEFSAGIESSFHFDRQHIEDGRTLMISWRATDNAGTFNGEPDPDRARKIANGQFDTEIRAMAVALRDLEAPLLLRFNWEMDQDVGDNQYIGPPAQFIAAWRHAHAIFERVGADNVEWVWSPRAASFNKDVGPLFYPGDSFVDWVGGSAVPINSFRDPETIYQNWYDWASSRNFPKPMMLWLGLRENPNDPTWKGDFIDDLEGLISGPWANVKAFVYYNSGSPLGFNYRISTSARATREYTELACSSHFETNFSC